MARIEITADKVIVQLEGARRLWALKNRVEVPLGDIRRVTAGPGERRGIRAPGTSIPGVYRAGTYRGWTYKDFWDVRRPEHSIVLELGGDGYARIVVDVDDPQATIAAVEAALR